MKTNSFSTKSWLILVMLLSPSVCSASDMSGALPLFFSLFIVFFVVAGLAVAALLRFRFKTGKKVWSLVLALPVLAVIGLMISSQYPHDAIIHAGPAVNVDGGLSVTVSKKFGRVELDHAYAKIQSTQFKSDLRKYTHESVSNYIFAIDLIIQPDRDPRSVRISIQPPVDVDTPTYEGVMYLFFKAVYESDPSPSYYETRPEPTRLVQSNTSNEP